MQFLLTCGKCSLFQFTFSRRGRKPAVGSGSRRSKSYCQIMLLLTRPVAGNCKYQFCTHANYSKWYQFKWLQQTLWTLNSKAVQITNLLFSYSRFWYMVSTCRDKVTFPSKWNSTSHHKDFYALKSQCFDGLVLEKICLSFFWNEQKVVIEVNKQGLILIRPFSLLLENTQIESHCKTTN